MDNHAALVRATVNDAIVGGALLEVNRELDMLNGELGPVQQPPIRQAQIAKDSLGICANGNLCNFIQHY